MTSSFFKCIAYGEDLGKVLDQNEKTLIKRKLKIYEDLYQK